MKKKTRISILSISFLAVSITFTPVAALAGNWAYDGGNWRFENNDGTRLISQWFQDEDGIWYYLDHEGNMMTDCLTPDGYRVREDGAWDQKVPQRALYPHVVPDETCNHMVGKHGEPIFQVDTEKRQVAFSFDSGSVFDYTDEILEILERHGIRSTFFLTKDWMDSHEESVLKIYEKGHEIGNHSVNHPDMTEMTPEQITVQIQQTHQKIRELTGREAFLFRAPYGAYDTKVVDTVKQNGYYCIQWSVDSLDWKNLGVQPILDRVLHSGKLGNGSIILMHDGAEYTPQALETLITEIEADGYEIVPVSELIYTRNYKLDVYGIQHPVEPVAAALGSAGSDTEVLDTAASAR